MAKDKAKPSDSEPESQNFQAEVSRLLELMVHSVYTEKEIFLRELISNASDACDKLRYEALTDDNLLAEDGDLKITLQADAKAGTLSVRDNGIGMSRQELIENLGTIARSGTKAFLDHLKGDQEGGQLIGQFGVGFYSAFMVADHVDVVSRKAGEEAAHIWSSDGTTGFSVRPASAQEAGDLKRGTIIRLHLKDDAKSFLDPMEIRRIVHAYSDHITFPIELEMPADEAGASEGEAACESGEEDAGAAPQNRTEQLNRASALWTRPKAEITSEEYKEFYHHVAAAFDEPAHTIHFRAEGRHEYTALLFLPTMQPFDLYDPTRKGRIKLYVRRVFVTDDADILPAYLRFVRGVIDSQDMPLNISREMLQNNPTVAAIRKAVTGRVLNEIKGLAEKEPEKFETLWEAVGAVLKEGLYEDPERRDALYEIARFKSTEGEGWRSLKDYVGDMKEKQSAIYYMTGDSREQIEASPQLEGFRSRGIEVLLLTDPIDNFWVTGALGFEGKPFKSVTQGDADLSEIPLADEKGATETAQPRDTATLIAFLKQTLSEVAEDVTVSARLVDSPACLVASQMGPDRGLEKILARQDRGTASKPILEVNAGHRIVQAVEAARASGALDRAEDLGWLLFDEASILEGGTPNDPAKFAERMNRLVLAGLSAPGEDDSG